MTPFYGFPVQRQDPGMCPTRVDAVEKRFCGLERTTLIQNSPQLCSWLGREHGGSIPLAGERAGFGALPGLRPSDSPRTQLFFNADGNIAPVRRYNPRGTRGSCQ